MDLPDGVTRAPTGARQEEISPKRYGIAVVLSAAVGWIGLQHFYLGRYGEGLLDVALTVGWIAALVYGEILLFAVLLLADFAHATVSTILLLIGQLNDGEGRRVCYPGQQLNTTR